MRDAGDAVGLSISHARVGRAFFDGVHLDDALTQDELWHQVQAWLPERAITIADAGTALYGALGTCLSAPERPTVLLIGDGAAQLTATELATIWQRGLVPVVLLIDDAGYTIERAIQSPRAPHQDVTAWDWTALPAALGASLKAEG